MGWLEKLSTGGEPARKKGGLPSLDLRDVKLPDSWVGRGGPENGSLPRASLVYGVGAGGILAFSLYSFFTGAWFTGLLLLLPVVGLTGFALYFIRHPS